MRFKVILTMTCFFVLAGCSSHMIEMDYLGRPAVVAEDVSSTVSVGGVTDSRGTAANWLGAIRGGYGNVLKKLLTSQPTTKTVESAFADALRARNLYVSLQESRYRLDIDIVKLDTSYFFNKEAHVAFTIDLVESSTGVSMFRETYRTDNVRKGAGAGIFGDAVALGEFANETLNQTIDQVLDDPKFIASIRRARENPHNTSMGTRLKELEELRSKGLITENEYSMKREQIISEL